MGRRAWGQGAVSAQLPPPLPQRAGVPQTQGRVRSARDGGDERRRLAPPQVTVPPAALWPRSAWPRIMPGRRTGPRSAGGGRSPDWGAVGGACDGGAVRAPGCRAHHHVPARGAGPSWDRPSAGPGAGGGVCLGGSGPVLGPLSVLSGPSLPGLCAATTLHQAAVSGASKPATPRRRAAPAVPVSGPHGLVGDPLAPAGRVPRPFRLEPGKAATDLGKLP